MEGVRETPGGERMKADPRSKRIHAIAALIALAALMASCDNILETIPRKDTGGGVQAEAER